MSDSRLKTQQIVVRVRPELYARVLAFLGAADLTMTDLVTRLLELVVSGSEAELCLDADALASIVRAAIDAVPEPGREAT